MLYPSILLGPKRRLGFPALAKIGLGVDDSRLTAGPEVLSCFGLTSKPLLACCPHSPGAGLWLGLHDKNFTEFSLMGWFK